ncbi:TetR/AcrR family transcriptional regulator [uncultured Ilumatobacter sp.]|jgi:AcrR family transcriptional regulator|uniref:TetR/AcrR family transcriptional regulator n=1 Tax=uncultured Ilumatobacter sp. TaxID=879968 RepID=UPI00374EDA4B
MADGWERRQKQKRRDVLVAAGSLISEHGLEGLTMRKLAARAGVAVATLYNQFGDRDGLLVAFVSNGLDQLEIEFDAEPAHGPIDTTRALFAALDAEFDSATDVWRPIFSTLKQGPGSHGMGEVGDRVVAFIEADFAKAAADGLFVIDCDVKRLARHVFTTRMNRLEKWATGAIEWDAYRDSSDLGLELTLAAVLADDNARRLALMAAGIRHQPLSC